MSQVKSENIESFVTGQDNLIIKIITKFDI